MFDWRHAFVKDTMDEGDYRSNYEPVGFKKWNHSYVSMYYKMRRRSNIGIKVIDKVLYKRCNFDKYPLKLLDETDYIPPACPHELVEAYKQRRYAFVIIRILGKHYKLRRVRDVLKQTEHVIKPYEKRIYRILRKTD